MAERQPIRQARPSAVNEEQVRDLFCRYITEREADAFNKRLDAGEPAKKITEECVALIKERQSIVMAVEAIFGHSYLSNLAARVGLVH